MGDDFTDTMAELERVWAAIGRLQARVEDLANHHARVAGLSPVETFMHQGDSEALRAAIRHTYDFAVSSVRSGVVPPGAFDGLMTAKALHLRELEKTGVPP